jgi:SAM-dependent methyltransferase
VSAADHYAALIAAVERQRERLIAAEPPTARWDRLAKQFRLDPRRDPDPNLAAIAALVEPGDVVLDVGGGAGRVSLPLALRCREVVNVDPSAGMGREFLESAAEAGITNARWVQDGWPSREPVSGDVSVVANVTYFASAIVPFVERLATASRRRVVITVWSVPPPNANAGLFRLVFGEEQALAPGHAELLPVLWKMGILPDVRVLPMPFVDLRPPPKTRDEAVTAWVEAMQPRDTGAARAKIEGSFGTLFRETERGFVPTWRPPQREMIITWETGAA